MSYGGTSPYGPVAPPLSCLPFLTKVGTAMPDSPNIPTPEARFFRRRPGEVLTPEGKRRRQERLGLDEKDKPLQTDD